MTTDRNQAARELLAFYLEAGVDAAVGEEAVDRFARAPAPPPTLPAAPASAPFEPERTGASAPETAAAERLYGAESQRALGQGRPRAGPPFAATQSPTNAAGVPGADAASVAPAVPEAAVMAARTAARSAASLDELRAILDRFEGCALRATASKLVFADGNPAARVMFVGEAPGRDEDIEGLPFVGRSGKLLDRMTAAIGLDRASVYIANIVPWRPPGNRTPTPQESAICLPFTLRQIELADPDILVCLGNPSTQTLLNTKEGITRTRGRWFNFDTGTRQIRAIPTYHPAFLLRTPLAKRLAWRDFLAIKAALARGAA
jgi:uracil-DNA glycosylase family 4